MFKNDSEVKLSIITVVFNNREGLCRTLESVKRQTFCDFEQIVIDGGSTDGTLEEIKKYESQIANFRWISEKDNGIYNAMNKGIKMAKGEYCYFLNSDDYIAAPNTLEKIFEKAKDADIIYGNLAIRKGENLKKVMCFSSKLTRFSFYRSKVAIHHQASLIKRELFLKHGFYREDIKIISDWIFFFEIVMLHKASTQYVNIIFAVFLSGGVSYRQNDVKNREIQIKQDILSSFFSPQELANYKKREKKRKHPIRIWVDKIYMRILLIKNISKIRI